MACHGAVRAHQHLHDHELRALLHDLAGAAHAVYLSTRPASAPAYCSG
jgi:hypothetical protein